MKSITRCFVLLALMTVTAGTAFGADKSAESVALVDSAVAFVREKGREYALKVFSAPQRTVHRRGAVRVCLFHE